MTKNDLYLELFNKFQDKQIVVAIEELSELQKELCKYLRGKATIENIYEEVADVEIIVEQLKLFFNLSNNKLGNIKTYKLNRTQSKILGEDR